MRKEDLQLHDRILAHQYACHAAIECGQYEEARKIAHLGLQLAPMRAEFQVMIGDSYLKQNQPREALPFFAAAKYSKNMAPANSPYHGAVFTHDQCYGEYPRNQMARILFHSADIDLALKEAKENEELYGTPETRGIREEIEKLKTLSIVSHKDNKVDDIVITTPPVGAYPWDEEIYKTKGMGGSETAAIEMSRWLKKLTGRPVKIFNANREQSLICESGVEYRPANQAPQYLAENQPKVHIQWRHNIRLTNAPSYLWCHDLVTQGCEVQKGFDKMLCLTPFHRDYVNAVQGVSKDDIIVTRNGLNPDRFQFERPAKDPSKMLWLSSPDRGLDRAMLVLDRARKVYPDLKLHVYYGLENLEKYGLHDLSKLLWGMMKERDWVVYHGFTVSNALSE